jgi:hypothetical protein
VRLEPVLVGKRQATYPKLCGGVEEHMEETLTFYRCPVSTPTPEVDQPAGTPESSGGPTLSASSPTPKAALRLIRALAVEMHKPRNRASVRALEAKLAAITASSPVIQSTEISAMPREEPAMSGFADQGTLPGVTIPVSRRRISSVTACARSGLSITRGVSSTSNSVRALLRFLVLKRAPMIGIDDRIGTPLRLRSVLSVIKPPSATVCPCWTATVLLTNR